MSRAAALQKNGTYSERNAKLLRCLRPGFLSYTVVLSRADRHQTTSSSDSWPLGIIERSTVPRKERQKCHEKLAHISKERQSPLTCRGVFSFLKLSVTGLRQGKPCKHWASS